MGYVQATPVWENPSHNNVRKTCFKNLAASCITALKKGNFTKEQCEEIKKKLTKLREGSDEINICLKHLDEGKKYFTKTGSSSFNHELHLPCLTHLFILRLKTHLYY